MKTFPPSSGVFVQNETYSVLTYISYGRLLDPTILLTHLHFVNCLCYQIGHSTFYSSWKSLNFKVSQIRSCSLYISTIFVLKVFSHFSSLWFLRVLFHVVATFIEHLKNLKILKRPSTGRAARPLLPAGGRRLTQGWNPRLTPEEEGEPTCTTTTRRPSTRRLLLKNE